MVQRRLSWLSALVAGMIIFPAGIPSLRAASSTASGGWITGRVYFRGVKPRLPQISMAQDRVCASEQTGPVYPEDGRVNANGTLPNVFVYVKGGLGGQTYPAPSTPVTLDQRRCEYVPHVLGIMVGQPLKVVSSDPTTHNIHVMAKYNRSWNVSQQPGSPPIPSMRSPGKLAPLRSKTFLQASIPWKRGPPSSGNRTGWSQLRWARPRWSTSHSGGSEG